ncbi:hypothetical protein SteCoe_10966 [Stentor coeruleus]|uniref:Uncharacterized protein n=1 Tax=Stentor coeruleus TaxID=5963 RepID=A0A1R2CEB9_9CILI|nr:hypothetical protein SteCoe_10966 [Stentor coeruleus]
MEEGKAYQDHNNFSKDIKESEAIRTIITSTINSNNFQAEFYFKYKFYKTVYDIIYAWVKKENNINRLGIFARQIVIENNNIIKVEFDTHVSSLITDKGIIELKISQENNLERVKPIGVKILDNTDIDNFIVNSDISMKYLRQLISLYCKKHAKNIGLSSTYHIYDDYDTLFASGALEDGFIIAHWVNLCSKRKNN